MELFEVVKVMAREFDHSPKLTWAMVQLLGMEVCGKHGGSKNHWCPNKRFNRFFGVPDSKTL